MERIKRRNLILFFLELISMIGLYVTGTSIKIWYNPIQQFYVFWDNTSRTIISGSDSFSQVFEDTIALYANYIISNLDFSILFRFSNQGILKIGCLLWIGLLIIALVKIVIAFVQLKSKTPKASTVVPGLEILYGLAFIFVRIVMAVGYLQSNIFSGQKAMYTLLLFGPMIIVPFVWWLGTIIFGYASANKLKQCAEIEEE